MNEWMHVMVTQRRQQPRRWAAALREWQADAESKSSRTTLTKEITGGGGDNISLGERFRDRGFKGGAIDDFRVFGRELTPLEALATCDQAAANAGSGKGSRTTELTRRARVVRLLSRDRRCGLGEASRRAESRARRLGEGRGRRCSEIMVMRELPAAEEGLRLESRRIQSAPRRGPGRHARRAVTVASKARR